VASAGKEDPVEGMTDKQMAAMLTLLARDVSRSTSLEEAKESAQQMLELAEILKGRQNKSNSE